MRYFLLLLVLLVAMTLLYYVTAICHIIFNMFGDDVTFPKILIPFYGWIKVLKN